jgi:hypothetical protein
MSTPFGLKATNGYDMITAGRFVGQVGDGIFLLERGGRHRILYRDGNETWKTTEPREGREDLFPIADTRGYDMITAGRFEYGAGDDIFLLARDGRNRILYRDGSGTWNSTGPNKDRQDPFPFPTKTTEGYDMITAGQFGYTSGDNIFLLADNGKNRILYRDGSKTWKATEPRGNREDLFRKETTNGYDMITAGQFGGAVGTDILLFDSDPRPYPMEETDSLKLEN